MADAVQSGAAVQKKNAKMGSRFVVIMRAFSHQSIFQASISFPQSGFKAFVSQRTTLTNPVLTFQSHSQGNPQAVDKPPDTSASLTVPSPTTRLGNEWGRHPSQ